MTLDIHSLITQQLHNTLFRSVGSLRGSTKFCKSIAPNFCENFIKEKLLIFIKESTFVNVAKPRNGGFVTKMAQSMGYVANLGKNPNFAPLLWPNHPFLGLATFRKVDSLMKMSNFSL